MEIEQTSTQKAKAPSVEEPTSLRDAGIPIYREMATPTKPERWRHTEPPMMRTWLAEMS